MRTGISKLFTILFYLLCCAALIWASGLSILNRPFTSRAMNNNRLNTEPTINRTSIADDPDAHFLDNNLGDEIEVLPQGLLMRVLKFSLCKGGKLINTDVFVQNALWTRRLVVPVKVHGNEDGNGNNTAWKTGVFYGTLLANLALV